MNAWIRRSIKLANARGYLDALHQVYSPSVKPRKKLTVEEKQLIGSVFASRNKKKLISVLLERGESFPFKDSYVACLRADKRFLEWNPKTTKRIAGRLFGLKLKGIFRGLQREKEANTAIGPQFGQWLLKLGFPFIEPEEFVRRKRGVAFLAGSEKQLMKFANNSLECNLKKRPDFVANVRGNFVIGEAKFLTATGGNQNNSFEDALELVKGTQGRAMRIAVLDGIVWLPASGKKMFERLKVCGGDMLSALLLKKYLNSL